ncbi:MAG: precorrin-6y C5,15-methyltransferase (decarboxylating) subunit CbiE [Clostridium sp.]|uniref:precorrin-6y C5,15-methyltransferase (decarboxylating) subunit CbiE n=1 Tax=Clostridium sp. TaxID=1506 RepID=UPI002FC79EBA
MKIYIVGVGVKSHTTNRAIEIINSSDVLIGAKRVLSVFENNNAKRIESYKVCDINKAIEENHLADVISILVSGDSGFFSAAESIVQGINRSVEIIPGISSLSYFAARLSIPFDDINVLSLHGRHGGLVGSVMENHRTFILTDGTNSPRSICRSLYKKGFRNLKVYIGENLSYPNERITVDDISVVMNMDFDPLNVLIIENPRPVNINISLSGIADEEFIRGDVPMTKCEVRRISISKLKINRDDVIYDIGAGTGSVAIEAALSATYGRVYAIEKEEKAINIIESNRIKFKAYNMKVIHGFAPSAMEDLPAADKVFVGGSCGQLESIIENAFYKNPYARIVVNAISLETISEALSCFKKFPFKDVEITQASIAKARSIGEFNMMMGQNPVYIFSGEGNGTWQE